MADNINYLEALAVLEGIALAVAKGWDVVDLESDSVIVVNHIKGTVCSQISYEILNFIYKFFFFKFHVFANTI